MCVVAVDASQGGVGNLEIMINDGQIPCSVQNRGNRQFHATFTPKDPIPHYIQMKFNGMEVPGRYIFDKSSRTCRVINYH